MATVTLELVIDSKGNVRAVEDAGKGLDKVNKDSQSAAGGFKNLKAAAELAVGAFAALKAASAVIDLARLGAQAEAVEQRFQAFAGGAAKANQYLRAFQEGTTGAVDKMGAMQGAAKLLQMSLVTNADEMETIAGIAVRLGDQTVGASQRLSDFAMMLSNQSIPRLDNFGISSGKVRQRIDELLKSGQALSRDQAFKMAVIEEGSKALAILGDTSETTGVKLQRMDANLADVKTEFGRMVSSIASASGALDSLVSWASDTADATEEIRKHGLSIRNWAEAVGVYLQTGSRTEAIDAFTGRMEEATIAVEDSNEELHYAYTTALPDFSGGVYDANAAVNDELVVMENAMEAHKGYALSIDEAIVSLQNERMATLELSAALADASAQQIARAALDDLKAALDAGTISFDFYEAAVMQTQLAYGLATPESVKLSQGIGDLTERAKGGKMSADEYRRGLNALMVEFGNAKRAADELSARIRAIPDRTVNVRVRYSGGTGESMPGGPALTQQAGGWNPGGLTLVGEVGPELVILPKNSYVLTATETRQAKEALIGGEVGGGSVALPGEGTVTGGPAPIAGGGWAPNPATLGDTGRGTRYYYIQMYNNFGPTNIESAADMENVADKIAQVMELRGAKVWEA